MHDDGGGSSSVAFDHVLVSAYGENYNPHA